MEQSNFKRSRKMTHVITFFDERDGTTSLIFSKSRNVYDTKDTPKMTHAR